MTPRIDIGIVADTPPHEFKMMQVPYDARWREPDWCPDIPEGWLLAGPFILVTGEPTAVL